MKNKIKAFYKNNRIWIYLTTYILISLTLALGVILVDIRFIPMLDYIPSMFLTSVDLAKLILATLAGSLLTITTFTFSTIMVVLTMYSSNFSPRVVNNFLTDKITMRVLGIFVGGFFYCILTLLFMRNDYSQYSVLSATIAVIYAAFCIINFVIFVYRVAYSIQATKLISELYEEAYEIIERTLNNRKNLISLEGCKTGLFKYNLDVISDKSGYLELIDFKYLFKILKDIEVKMILKLDIGAFVSKNQEIATIYYNEDNLDEELTNKILRGFYIEEERIEYNDYRFSLQKIVDITLRAISPGINDPNTAIDCINILGVLLSKLGEIEGVCTVIKNEDSKAIIMYEDFNFDEDLYFTFYQIVHYGKKDISIVLAILNALKTISRSSTIEKRSIIEEFSEYIYDNSINNFTHRLDLEVLKKAKEAI